MKITLFRSVLKLGAGALLVDGSYRLDALEIIIGSFVALFSVLWDVFEIRADRAESQPGKSRHNAPPLIILCGMLALPGLLVTSCRSLAPGGVHHGDDVLYNAELTINTSYAVIHAFVKWEKDNRAALAKWPEIKRTADGLRRNAKPWFDTAHALRDAYAADPNPANADKLLAAVRVLRAALTEATAHMARAAGGVTPPK